MRRFSSAVKEMQTREVFDIENVGNRALTTWWSWAIFVLESATLKELFRIASVCQAPTAFQKNVRCDEEN